jgi:hypothetical protein
LMILAFIWGGYMLLLQFKSLQSFSIGRHVGSK